MLFDEPVGCIRQAVSDMPRVEQFDELLIQHAHLVHGEATILVEYTRERPLLDLAQTAHETAGTMLALVAVDEDRVVGDVEQDAERIGDDILGDVDERLLVALDAELQHIDVVRVVELDVVLGAVLGAQVDERPQLERGEERVVRRRRVARPVDAGHHHGEVQRRQHAVLRRHRGAWLQPALHGCPGRCLWRRDTVVA